MSPTTAIEWNNEGLDRYNAKEYDQAAAALLKAIELDPTNPIFYKNLGDVYYDNQKKADGMAYYKTAITMEPKNVNFLVDFGLILHGEHQDKEALPYLLRAVEIEGQNQEVLYLLTAVYYELDEIQMAIKYGQRVVKQDPTHENTVMVLGRCYIKQSNFSAAENLFDGFLKIKPNSANVLFLRSQVYQKQHQIVQAIDANQRAYHIDSNNPTIALTLYTYFEEASLYGRMFTLVNNYRNSHRGTAEYMGAEYPRSGKKLRDYFSLGIDFRKAVSADTQDQNFASDLEKIEAVWTQFQKFLDQIIALNQAEPEQTATILFASFLAITEKNFAKALNLLTDLTDRMANEIYYYLYGIVSMFMKSYEQSYRIWRIFVKMGKENGPINLFYAYCATQIGETDFAQEQLQRSYTACPEWQSYFPSLEALKSPTIEDDLFGIAILRAMAIFRNMNQSTT